MRVCVTLCACVHMCVSDDCLNPVCTHILVSYQNFIPGVDPDVAMAPYNAIKNKITKQYCIG